MKKKRTPGEVMWTTLDTGRWRIPWNKLYPLNKRRYERMAKQLIAAFKKL